MEASRSCWWTTRSSGSAPGTVPSALPGASVRVTRSAGPLTSLRPTASSTCAVRAANGAFPSVPRRRWISARLASLSAVRSSITRPRSWSTPATSLLSSRMELPSESLAVVANRTPHSTITSATPTRPRWRAVRGARCSTPSASMAAPDFAPSVDEHYPRPRSAPAGPHGTPVRPGPSTAHRSLASSRKAASKRPTSDAEATAATEPVEESADDTTGTPSEDAGKDPVKRPAKRAGGGTGKDPAPSAKRSAAKGGKRSASTSEKPSGGDVAEKAKDSTRSTSVKRAAAAESTRTTGRRVAAATQNPSWLAPTAVVLLILGLAYLVTYYISSGQLPLPIGDWNLAAGFGVLMVGGGMLMFWK